jgi:hypothetical protein
MECFESFLPPKKKENVNGPDIVAHTYNPSYSGSRSGRQWFEDSPGKKLARSHLNKKLGMHLSFQLCRRHKVGGSQYRAALSAKNVRPT